MSFDQTKLHNFKHPHEFVWECSGYVFLLSETMDPIEKLVNHTLRKVICDSVKKQPGLTAKQLWAHFRQQYQDAKLPKKIPEWFDWELWLLSACEILSVRRGKYFPLEAGS